MIEVNTAVFVILIEAFVGLLVLLILMLVFGMRRRKRRQSAIAQLVAQIKKQSQVRTSETGSFLQEIYQLDGGELKEAVASIDKGEKQFFQKLINSYLTDDADIITAMDASIAELIDIYKALKPKVEEHSSGLSQEELQNNIDELTGANDRLKEELSITKETMGNMIAEFGNMFGGGSGHELAKYEVVKKVGVQSDETTGEIELPDEN